MTIILSETEVYVIEHSNVLQIVGTQGSVRSLGVSLCWISICLTVILREILPCSHNHASYTYRIRLKAVSYGLLI